MLNNVSSLRLITHHESWYGSNSEATWSTHWLVFFIVSAVSAPSRFVGAQCQSTYGLCQIPSIRFTTLRSATGSLEVDGFLRQASFFEWVLPLLHIFATSRPSSEKLQLIFSALLLDRGLWARAWSICSLDQLRLRKKATNDIPGKWW